MSDDNITLSNTADLNYLVPVTTDKEPIIFEDNDATIDGILYEVGRFYKRNGLFQTLFAHRAVALSNGKLAVESPNSVYFAPRTRRSARRSARRPRQRPTRLSLIHI